MSWQFFGLIAAVSFGGMLGMLLYEKLVGFPPVVPGDAA